LRLLLSLPTATAAAWLGRSEGAVRVLLHRAGAGAAPRTGCPMTDERARAANLDRRLSARLPNLATPSATKGIWRALPWTVRRALQPPAPRAAFTVAARRRLLSRLPAHLRLAWLSPGPFGDFAFAAVSVVLAFTLGTASVAYAAQEALPGEPLYGVKRGIESARWSLTTSPRRRSSCFPPWRRSV